jgi:hypothetical protein
MRRLAIFVLIFLTMTPLTAFSQGEPGIGRNSLGIGGEFSIPVGDLNNVAGLGYGGFARFQHGVDSRTALTFTAGYTLWTEEELGLNSKVETSAFRFLVGGKFYIAPSFFASIEAGTDAYKFEYSGSVIGGSSTEWMFMIPVGLGFQQNGFEVSGKFYVLDFDVPSFSITAGYNWILG